MMNKNLFNLIQPLHSSIFNGCFLGGIVAFFFLAVVWRCNAQHPQGQAVQDKGAGQIGTIDIVKDSIPKGKRIELLPREGVDYNWLFAFYDSKGNLVKKITDKQLPSHSKFSALDFPRMKEIGGESVE